jgi:DNA-binding transcriptional ArsR family regulator
MSQPQQSVFKALADPTRRSILKLLQKGSLTAGAIADAYPITRASLSHHFNILKAADLVRTERRGQHIVYSLNATVLQEAAALLLDLFAPAEKGANTRKNTKPSSRNAK